MKNRHLAICTILVLTLLFSVVSVFAEPQGILKGKVFDEETKEPIAEAVVEIEKLNIKVVTDEDGFYTIGGIRVGFHDVKVSHSNYNAKAFTAVGVAANVVTTLNFELKKKTAE
ncbi:MAG: carboxypeptidase regulatory-like domain-containing protein, partial [bacterium]|nr:carboxypeptidase regulatory-like domain-containing protein [bacterium]